MIHPVSLNEQSAEPSAVQGPWPTVLCVDDDPNVASAMQRNFRPYRIQLECAFHGMQGIMAAVTEPPDVIITDLQMPLASGEELIECLGRNPSTLNTPVIVITGRPDARLTADLKQYGVISLLTKPLAFDDLLQQLSYVIDVELR